MVNETRKTVQTGKDLLSKSVKQVAVILLAANVLVLLTDAGVIGTWGWRSACIVLLALGVFCLRIFGAIAWAGRGESDH